MQTGHLTASFESADLLSVKAIILIAITLLLLMEPTRNIIEAFQYTEPELNKLFQMSGQMPCSKLLQHFQPDDRLCGLFVLCVGDSPA